MTRLPRCIRRIVALALLVLVLWIGWVAIVHPLAAKYGGLQERIELTQELLSRYQRLESVQAQLKDQMERASLRTKAHSGLFTNEGRTLAGAELQQRVKQLVTQHGGTLLSSQILPGTEEDTFVPVVLRARMRVDIEALQNIFYTLETSQPFLFVDNLVVRSSPASRSARATQRVTRQVGPQFAADLDVMADVVGYMRRDAE